MSSTKQELDRLGLALSEHTDLDEPRLGVEQIAAWVSTHPGATPQEVGVKLRRMREEAAATCGRFPHDFTPAWPSHLSNESVGTIILDWTQ